MGWQVGYDDEWNRWLLTDESWNDWRNENPEQVTRLREAIAAKERA